jgi:phosphatidylethanolamine-binding protein (PEBP) family uncharacterized protein
MPSWHEVLDDTPEKQRRIEEYMREKRERELEQQPPQPPLVPAGGPRRSALEVLSRMYNGLDPFDQGRYKAAVAALPHETPRLSANVSETRVITGNGYAAKLERLRVIDAQEEANRRWGTKTRVTDIDG